jgi:hypothetical protein
MSLLRRIRWENIIRLVVIFVFISMSVLNIYNFIEIYNLRGEYKLNEERIVKIHKGVENVEETTRNFRNSIKGISAELTDINYKLNEFISENDFDSVFIVGRKNRDGYYYDIKVTIKGEEIYNDEEHQVINGRKYQVIGGFKSYREKKN